MDRSVRSLVPGFVLLATLIMFAISTGQDLPRHKELLVAVLAAPIPIGYFLSSALFCIFLHFPRLFLWLYGSFDERGKDTSHESTRLSIHLRKQASYRFHERANDGTRDFVARRWTVFFTNIAVLLAIVLAVPGAWLLEVLRFDLGDYSKLLVISSIPTVILVPNAIRAKNEAIEAEMRTLSRKETEQD